MNWLELILGIATLLVTALVAPLVKSKLSEGTRKDLDYWVRYLVAAAEVEIDGEKMGTRKLNVVIGELKRMGLVDDKNEERVKHLITGVCQELTAAFIINRDHNALVSEIREMKGE